MRHFEKKTGTFRRFDLRGSTLQIAIGKAGDDEHLVSIRCKSAAAASRTQQTWVRWALDAGFAEVELPEGAQLGVVATLKGPNGPGRIRLDAREDVHFLEAKDLGTLAIGQRVIATGVHRVAKLRLDWMQRSRQRAKRVWLFPAPKWSASRAKPDASAKVRKALERLAGPAFLGHAERRRAFPRRLVPGTLIFAYEKGVHRFLRCDRNDHARREDYVLYENVLSSSFKRQTNPPTSCIGVFCEPIPPKLAREIARHYGI